MSMLKYWVWLSRLPNVGAAAASVLLDRFGTPKDVWLSRPEDMGGPAGLPRKILDSIKDKDLSEAEMIIDKCKTLGIDLLTRQDSQYPERLMNISDPPVVLYTKGEMISFDSEVVVALIGSRDCSRYGARAARALGSELARSGAVVLSGFARGIDSEAAWGSVLSGGRTVGVLGCGLDVVYPKENRALYNQAAGNGMLISEYPPGTLPLGQNFPVRNRIMSALSLAVAVVEARQKSGTMITVARALEQGKDVFAVPGDIGRPGSEGTNRLLGDGAYVLTSAEDILSQYRWRFPGKLTYDRHLRQAAGELPDEDAGGKYLHNEPDAATNEDKKEIDNNIHKDYIDLKDGHSAYTDTEIALLQALADGPAQVNDLAERAQIKIHEALAALTVLEMGGTVAQRPGKIFFRIDIK
jgi:DNA processing protein